MNANDNREELYELAGRFVSTGVVKSEIETFGQYDRRRFREFLEANRAAVLRALGAEEQFNGAYPNHNDERRFVTDWEDVPDERQ